MVPDLYSLRFRPRLYWPDGYGYWSGHLPFAVDLVDALKPKVLVELGTYYGESYFAFCQAIQERAIACQCWAVDNWEGDATTGRYGPSVFETVAKHNAEYYASFSSLLRTNFAEAAARFEDRSIDLLHLDGCHGYETARRDFDTWLPKVSASGVVLLHDIAVRTGGFAVWRLWEELSKIFPSFAFWHSSGLGVLVNSGGSRIDNPFLEYLVGQTCSAQAVREYYVLCSERLHWARKRVDHSAVKAQVYSPGPGGYTEERSEIAEVEPGKWTTFEIEIPPPADRLRLDPASFPSLIEVSEIEVLSPATAAVLWRLDAAHFAEINFGGTAFRIPHETRLVLVSYGDDPQLYLPALRLENESGPLRFRCSLCVHETFGCVEQVFRESSNALLRPYQSRLTDMEAQQGRLQLRLEDDARKAHQQVDELLKRLDGLTNSMMGDARRADHRANELLRQRDALTNSFSWRVTRPLRGIGSLLVRAHRILLRGAYETKAFPWTGKILAKAVYLFRALAERLLLPANPLFSSDHCAASHPDVHSDHCLWAHYLGFGGDEGRDPHPLFKMRYYLDRNPDVRVSGINALVHYLAYGAAENRRPHPSFDPCEYMQKRPDVRASGMNPLLHYWKHGRHEQSGEAPLEDSMRVTANCALTTGEQVAEVFPDLSTGPLISILLPTFNTPPEFLRSAIESVRRQIYSRWQLCVYDDGSSRTDTLSVLQEYAKIGDSRIVIAFSETNSGIARASNAALSSASRDYVAMLDHDDELEPDALWRVAWLLCDDPSLDVVYTDQDYVDVRGNRFGTLLKPDWSPELFRGVVYVNHLLTVRSDVLRQAGAFDPAFDGVQDFEAMLRISERTSRIGHVPRILYHWRSAPESILSGGNPKGALEPRQAAAVNKHLSRCGIAAIAAPIRRSLIDLPCGPRKESLSHTSRSQ